ncbi:MAG: hypothetical protein JJE53_02240 [Candidatus Pacebacteria bacterium]|nr:hypothetical protein [Candidatus Paceibacterota bacterium]
MKNKILMFTTILFILLSQFSNVNAANYATRVLIKNDTLKQCTVVGLDKKYELAAGWTSLYNLSFDESPCKYLGYEYFDSDITGSAGILTLKPIYKIYNFIYSIIFIFSLYIYFKIFIKNKKYILFITCSILTLIFLFYIHKYINLDAIQQGHIKNYPFDLIYKFSNVT